MEVAAADVVVASDWHDRVRLPTFGRLAAGGFWAHLGVS